MFGNINKKEFYIGNNKLFKKIDIKNEYLKDEEELIENGNSIIYVIENNKVLALIGVKDIIRENAKATIKDSTFIGNSANQGGAVSLAGVDQDSLIE